MVAKIRINSGYTIASIATSLAAILNIAAVLIMFLIVVPGQFEANNLANKNADMLRENRKKIDAQLEEIKVISEHIEDQKKGKRP